MTLSIDLARPEERPVLDNLMQLYIHDFSEQWAGMERGELQDDGLFPAYPLDGYWSEAARIPLLIRVGGKVAGLALINDHSHSGLPADRNVAEFFVVRKHRRGGVGTAAAQAIFSRWPGLWEAAVARRNLPALPFWRNAAASHPGCRGVEEIDVSDEHWNGPILRFRIEPAA